MLEDVRLLEVVGEHERFLGEERRPGTFGHHDASIEEHGPRAQRDDRIEVVDRDDGGGGDGAQEGLDLAPPEARSRPARRGRDRHDGRDQERTDTDLEPSGKTALISGSTAGIGLATAEAVFARVPAVDVLVNNLGIYGARPFVAITDAEWMGIFEANVMSGVRLARRHLPGMLARDWRRVLFISSEPAANIPAEMIH